MPKCSRCTAATAARVKTNGSGSAWPAPGRNLCLPCLESRERARQQNRVRQRPVGGRHRSRAAAGLAAPGRGRWQLKIPKYVIEHPFAARIPDGNVGLVAACPWLVP